MVSAVMMRVEGQAEVGGPEWFVNTREVEIHASERFDCVVIRFDSHVSHLAQPKVHSLSSPVSIFMEEVAVASE
jgi:hypothetical protein